MIQKRESDQKNTHFAKFLGQKIFLSRNLPAPANLKLN